MARFILVSMASGVILGVIDYICNTGSFTEDLKGFSGQLLLSAGKAASGLGINLALGFAMTGIFILLRKSFDGVIIAMGFALTVWFFRVTMFFIRKWMTFKAPLNDLVYVFIAGMSQMISLGILYELTLKPLAR
ncbi:hypothetical protein COY52_11335 [Candidatus Desantisbacteria bacterium CG_4_10_14_0_8_um_filter_48_22]|uniref:Uncharacterized protein n=1 Tax=Candidatus Desantisbacteria bacterium CG_4_10_14_0_8_um_filter_48_22 TaxID=1974543 RepID=A0A2M7S579_9BACT|nr:MAG: hypothetical protein COS16_10010 [Candidatus Desantisbacteria bacterium CG02_land_8_20_14_3_00_49_13]PIZ14705.1 MAG: hypothetical protein COY52_11335 [Candidatus Desantisbacteria bacterium CG_4_10_14_0_8_um_filter_48_22]PJB28840.1 MAG: hypothetical protein CO111_00540 [Candidatus Desantisbacteria bacterium CG_4_9_14_3_um_filter_50_7]